MSERTDVLRRVRVASPCRASWEAMEGDERVRFCSQCELHVYNLSEMTSDEASSLVARTEGRLCARFYRRADGTVLTKDCPEGLRAVRARAARGAGAVLASVLGLFAAVTGRSPQQKKSSCPAGDELRVERTLKGTSHATVSGVVTDPSCAVIPGAKVILTSRETGQKFTASTGDKGEFLVAALPPGTYTLEVFSPGFRFLSRDDFRVGAGESAHLRATLGLEELMGVIDLPLEEKHPIESKDGITIFRSEAVTRLPHP